MIGSNRHRPITRYILYYTILYYTKQSLQYTQAEVAELQDRCSSLELENKALMLKQARQGRQTRDIERRFDDLDFQIATVDNNTRKKNVLLEGIRETPREEPLEIAFQRLNRT